jgi:hypothetical protein
MCRKDPARREAFKPQIKAAAALVMDRVSSSRFLDDESSLRDAPAEIAGA